MKLTIEEKLQIALTKNPLTRDRLFLKVLKPSIEKCIYILLKNNKRYTRLHDADDLIQEANLTVLKVIQNQDMSKIKYALRTYLLGAIKRRIWGVVREEFALKRQAQHKAYPLDVLVQLKRVPQNIKPLNTGKENTMLEHFETKDIIFRIKEKLKSPAREIFQDLQDGYDIIEIAVNRSIPLQTVYTIIRRKIKPIAKRLMNIE